MTGYVLMVENGACGLAWIERRASNPDVEGSNPSRPVGTIFFFESDEKDLENLNLNA